MTRSGRRARRRPAVLLALAACAACDDATPTARAALETQTFLTPDGTVTLEGGVAEGPDDIVYRLLGTAEGDLDFDGEIDAAAVVTEGDGRAQLLRLHAFLSDGDRAEDVSARLLGDRIGLERLSIDDGLIRADLLTRHPGEPITTPPSLRISTYYALTDRGLVPVSPAAAGLEAGGSDDAAAGGPTLFSHRWVLASFEMGDWSGDPGALERAPELRFAPELSDPGGASGQLAGFTGCNRVFGRFRAEENATLRLSGLAATRRACPGAAGDFEARLLGAYGSVESYEISGARLEVRFVGGLLGFVARPVEPAETEADPPIADPARSPAGSTA